MSGSSQHQSIQGTWAATGGQAIAGNVYGNVYHGGTNASHEGNPPAARPDFSGYFSHSSLAPVKSFVQRPSLHNQIRAQLHDYDSHHSTSTLVIWGLGGAGKTQLALDYVQRYGAEYKAKFWIDAGQRQSLEQDYMKLYQALFNIRMLTEKDAVSIETAVNAVKSWFSGRQGPWLMVFDGADSIDDPDAEEYIDIKHFIPDVRDMHVVITSRCRTAKDMARLEGVEVGELGQSEAVELFYRYSEVQRSDQSLLEIQAIVKELGYLALAVTLAATYVSRSRRDVNSYLPEYHRRRHELLRQKPVKLVHQYKESVLTTWETSFQAINTSDCPQAAAVMTLISFFNSVDITGLLFEGMDLGDRTIEELLAKLESFSLLQWNKDRKSYSVHKLVHAWGQDRLSEEERQSTGTMACYFLGQTTGIGNLSPEDKLRLVPHVMANFITLENRGSMSHIPTEPELSNLEKLARFIYDIGRYTEARTILDFIFNKRRLIFGDDNTDTLSALAGLATAVGAQSRLDEELKMRRVVFEQMRRISGATHRKTLQAMVDLANNLGSQGQLGTAETMQRDVLFKYTQMFGNNDPDTYWVMTNLATTLKRQGQLSEAANLLEKILKEREPISGEDRLQLAFVKADLATILFERGELKKAEDMQREAFQEISQILGMEHPDTTTAMAGLAKIIAIQGQLDQAVTMQREVLQVKGRLLGEGHARTVLAASNLAVTLVEQDHLDEAISLLETAVWKSNEIYRGKHRFIQLAIDNVRRFKNARDSTSASAPDTTKRPAKSALQFLQSEVWLSLFREAH